MQLPAQYFIKNKSMRYEVCTIINLSRTGAAVLFPPKEIPLKGTFIFLDVLMPHTCEQVTLRGEVKRIYENGDMLVGGIKFETILPEKIFNNLK
jgi:hypothetical protein